ncbi:translation machinery-associated protein 20 [Diutina catenulata]
MFKKFTKEEIHSKSNIKSSAVRGLKSNFASQFPELEPVIDQVIPKKATVVQIKCEDKVSLYTMDDDVVAFGHYDDLYPSLKLVHKWPQCFPSVQVDRGAIKFVLSGANIMCPGLTSAGAKLPEENLPEGSIVVVNAEGKENAMALGKLLMSTDDIKEQNKGIGIELLTYLGDGIWSFAE